MQSLRLLTAVVLAMLVVSLSGCGDDPEVPEDGGADTGRFVRCGIDDDPDGDTISSLDEGMGDSDDVDGDGVPNAEDGDSDGDTISDADEAGDADCTTPPVDLDGDGIPDFLDADGNGDGTPDIEQLDEDLDDDGTPDARDQDIDGDGLRNVDEFGDGATPVDSDGDGEPDLRDTDSDGDTILDAHEGRLDPDRDGIPSYLDLDSDDDGIEDAIEAGDGDPLTPPRVCLAEIDPVSGEVRPDSLADYLDADSDNDGLSDGIERDLGTDLCNVDTDGDGLGDLAEWAYESVNCPGGSGGIDCGCATSATCGIPSEHFYVILPFLDEPQDRDLDFGTTIRVADVFFLTDTTGSMGSELTNVKETVGRPGTGLIDRISEAIPEAWYGGGQHDDFPFHGYGSAGRDEPFILAIGQTPPTIPGMAEGSGRAAVAAAFDRIALHSGADGPESGTEALYQIITGEGGSWTDGEGGMYTMPRYAADCLDGGYGAPCFRAPALPIIVHFTDKCSHEGPPGSDAGCNDYMNITPAAHTWGEMIEAMNTRGAKYVGIATHDFGGDCATSVGAGGDTPCFFMKRTAQETGTVDLDGNPLVYDLPDGGGAGGLGFADTVVGAIETIATRVPLDVDTALRDDPSDVDGVDATGFIKRRQPSCQASPAAEQCWWAPAGIEHDAAVALVDASTFFGAIPGTRVQFRITFQNDFYEGDTTAKVFVAFIDVRGGGSAVLDTRQVFIIVPATSAGLPI